MNEKLNCYYCNYEILIQNINRHYRSKKHLKNKELDNLKESHKNNYSHLSIEKINEIFKKYKTNKDNLELFDRLNRALKLL